MAEVQTAARLGEFGILLGGETVRTGAAFEVRGPYDGTLVGTVHSAGPAEIERAIGDAERAFAATRKLPAWKREAGGIMINDSSTFRLDHMPYGGMKQSGFGREGLRYAIEEMFEMKLVAYNRR